MRGSWAGCRCPVGVGGLTEIIMDLGEGNKRARNLKKIQTKKGGG